MSDPPQSTADPPKTENGHYQKEDGIEELRRIFIGQEKDQIAAIRERLDNPKARTEDLGSVISEAIKFRAKQDDTLKSVLGSTVEEIIKESVKNNPKSLADALFPVMGPAIRRAITSTIRGMIDSLNQVLSNNLSVQSVKWRIMSKRTGIPYAEIVLMNTLVYQVEQVFLIHRETGLLLQSVARQSLTQIDPDMVSSMLTAIQDFARDSFKTQKDEGLETLDFGNLTIWIEQGPKAVIAAVTRGNPPHSLRTSLQDTLEAVHLQHVDSLESFDGNVDEFESSREMLEGCLLSQDKEKEKKSRTSAIAVIVVLALAVGLFAFDFYNGKIRFGKLIDRLRAEPGIVVTDFKSGWRTYHIHGLLDPLAAKPDEIIKDHGLEPKNLSQHWEPYYALNPEIVLKRVRQLLNPPASVDLNIKDNVLYADGSAPKEWIVSAGEKISAIPGIVKYQENLVNEKLVFLEQSRKFIEGSTIIFDLNSFVIEPEYDEQLDALVQEINKMLNFSGELGMILTLDIIGSTDQIGSEERNYFIRERRAEAVRSALLERGLTFKNINTVYSQTSETDNDGQAGPNLSGERSVTFKVKGIED